ncbi:hypothetical protein SDJN03_13302, partial [Cucurbita argyrosperma subsp. sororia]
MTNSDIGLLGLQLLGFKPTFPKVFIGPNISGFFSFSFPRSPSRLPQKLQLRSVPSPSPLSHFYFHSRLLSKDS